MRRAISSTIIDIIISPHRPAGDPLRVGRQLG